MRILEVTQDDFEAWVGLALELWSDSTADEMRSTLTHIFESPREAGFLVKTSDGEAVAFMNLSLRQDYVPGANHSPVAYVEGIYVRESYRKQGIGKSLIEFAEQWARQQGCTELASDALLDNTVSHQFHQQTGFQEVERVVAFIKPLSP
ncbi:aminoglycoside 6'-N-acetyltransferase [Leptolyngbya ohadii]|uniref:aminoglycoside 6'-N-acetyltransferase n=1 Tax=Leptolyngbya ohadii TaxID=1962290 RepID=UPI000B59AF2C|nr:aminoglycoside 6'-N-acetyltransferase [Leptolyngbya ohadii]